MADWQNRVKGYRVVKASELTPNDKNWRKHPKPQKDALEDVLNRMGWIAPVIYNVTTGRLIDGHLRQSLDPNALVPVVDVELSEDEERVALATFDPIGAMAEADKVALEGLLTALQKEDETLAKLLGAIAEDNAIALSDGASVPDVAPQIDKAKELQTQWQTERGQVWLVGGLHRVMCGDSTNADDVARLMGGKKADCVVTDPPYGIKRDRGFGNPDAIKPANVWAPRRYYNDEWDDERPPKEAFDLMLAHAKEAIIFGGNFFADLLPISTHWLVWDKLQTMPTFGDCELAWTSFDRKSVKKYTYQYSGLIGKEKERFHPTQKPVGLFVELVGDYTDEGATVLDLFLGSGTTLIACAQTGRVCYGMEISPEYVAVILQRAKDAGMSCELMRPTPSPSPLRGEGNNPVSDGGKIG